MSVVRDQCVIVPQHYFSVKLLLQNSVTEPEKFLLQNNDLRFSPRLNRETKR